MNTEYSNESQYGPLSLDARKRGAMVYSAAQLIKLTGRDQKGRLLQAGWEQPYFYLTIEQRTEIFRLCSPVFGVVTSRMNRMSGLDFVISTEKKEEDKQARNMKDLKSLYDEYKGSLELNHIVLKSRIIQMLMQNLPDLMPDASNFDTAMVRWKNRLKDVSSIVTTEAHDWLLQPNNGLKWEDFVKKWIFDMHVHGACAVYKQSDTKGGRVKNFDVLPGGTVYRIKDTHFSTMSGYIQVVPGYTEPGIYFDDEIVYSEYIPTSNRSHGMIPLEALINKVSEALLFDNMMANQADGTAPPEKLVIVTDNNPFGSLDAMSEDVPLDKEEQERIEEKLNTPVKNKVMTFSGNSAQVIDLTKENTMAIQMQRQKDIREEVALVYNMSMMEINMSGSEGTSGRATSEAQADIEQGKGIAPHAKTLSNVVMMDILPYAFPKGLTFEFQKSKSELEEKQLDQMMLNTGELTKNELREKYDKSGFGPEYDKPEGGGQVSPGNDQMNPLYMQQI